MTSYLAKHPLWSCLGNPLSATVLLQSYCLNACLHNFHWCIQPNVLVLLLLLELFFPFLLGDSVDLNSDLPRNILPECSTLSVLVPLIRLRICVINFLILLIGLPLILDLFLLLLISLCLLPVAMSFTGCPIATILMILSRDLILSYLLCDLVVMRLATY
jgi:hypothetical protein